MVISDGAEAQANYSLQDGLYRLLQERDWSEYIREMVRWEEAHPPENVYDGWQWHTVHTPPSIINSLVSMGFVDVRSESRKYTYYRLRALEDTREALAMLNVQPATPGPIDLTNMFGLVVGHEAAKQLLLYAIKADSPVHCLLMGPPGTAKTLMLSDVGALPQAEMYVGSTTTKAGLVALLVQAQPRYLVIDEIDKMGADDMTPLLNLMETGMVTRLQHKIQQRVSLKTKVFAGANDARRITQPILSRFAKIEIPAYTDKQFVEVATAVLVQREGLGAQMALHVASEVVQYTTDIRDAVRVARMARGNPHAVYEVIRCLWGDHGGGRPPITLRPRL